MNILIMLLMFSLVILGIFGMAMAMFDDRHRGWRTELLFFCSVSLVAFAPVVGEILMRR